MMRTWHLCELQKSQGLHQAHKTRNSAVSKSRFTVFHLLMMRLSNIIYNNRNNDLSYWFRLRKRLWKFWNKKYENLRINLCSSESISYLCVMNNTFFVLNFLSDRRSESVIYFKCDESTWIINMYIEYISFPSWDVIFNSTTFFYYVLVK